MVTQSTLCPGKTNFKIYDHAVDLNEYIKQIKLPISLYPCAPMSKLPSNINTMMVIMYTKAAGQPATQPLLGAPAVHPQPRPNHNLT